MEKNNKRSWKYRFAILMVILTIIIYTSQYLILGNGEEIISYIWLHLGFIPVDILIVGLLLEEIMSKKEKETILEKIDMLMGTFFSEVGNELLKELSKANTFKANTEHLKSINSWETKDYKNALKRIEKESINFNSDYKDKERFEFLNKMKIILSENREFLINLLNNPNLLEKDEFSSLVLALFHLDEELEHRSDITNISDVDFNHLVGDMKRVYTKLIYEWIYYLEYLNRNYPYMISIAIRTNPFDDSADIHVKE